MNLFPKKILFSFLILCIPVFSLKATEPSGFVNDFAAVIDRNHQEKLENLLQSFNQQTGIEIAIVTLGKLPEGENIETFATTLFQNWGIGKKRTDEGFLILAVIEERLLRIETGYGLEADLPDAYTARVARERIHPSFREGKFGEGFLLGVSEFIQHIAQKRNLDLSQIPNLTQKSVVRHSSLSSKILQFFIGLYILFLVIRHPSLLFFLLLGRGGSGRGMGGFGGGFGGFGGGLSGGGGSTTRW